MFVRPLLGVQKWRNLFLVRPRVAIESNQKTWTINYDQYGQRLLLWVQEDFVTYLSRRSINGS